MTGLAGAGGLSPGDVEVTSFGTAAPEPAGIGPGDFAPGSVAGADPDAADLPRRVRQASLAPQLRDSTAEPPPAPMAEVLAPTPEEARSTMTAIQHGWERGRSVFDPPGDARPDVESGEPPGPPAAAPVNAAGPTSDTKTTGLPAGEASSDSGGTSG